MQAGLLLDVSLCVAGGCLWGTAPRPAPCFAPYASERGIPGVPRERGVAICNCE